MEETREATHNLIPVHCITPFCSDALGFIAQPLSDEATRSFAVARFGSVKAIGRTGSVGTERSRV